MNEEMVKEVFSPFSPFARALLMNIDSNIILAHVARGIAFPVAKWNDQET